MQKGFSSLVSILLIVVVGIVSFYFGTKYKTSQPNLQTSNQVVATDSANFMGTNSILNVQSPGSLSNVTPIQANSDELIVLQGDYQYSNNKIQYNFSFPKSGGDIKGKLEGICDGAFTGNYNGGGENSLTGNFDGHCTAGPILFIRPQVKATFTGDVHKDTGKVNIRFNMTDPTSYQGSFELNFAK